MKKIFVKIYFYLKYPHQLMDRVKYSLRIEKAEKRGIKFLAPNYIFKDILNDSCVVVDVGCGYLAELSTFFINTYGVKAYGVDPTLKHKNFLKKIEVDTKGRFKHLAFAISSIEGKVNFHETTDHESGSILEDHVNILKDTIQSYEVETKNLKDLISHLDLPNVDFLKLDLEGAEYDLLEKVEASDLLPFKQIFIEFHHRAIKRYKARDTKKIVKLIRHYGYNYFSLDDVNYLFYK